MDKTDPFNIAIIAAGIAGTFTIIGVIVGFGLERFQIFVRKKKTKAGVPRNSRNNTFDAIE
jgi:hypothetical protein